MTDVAVVGDGVSVVPSALVVVSAASEQAAAITSNTTQTADARIRSEEITRADYG